MRRERLVRVAKLLAFGVTFFLLTRALARADLSSALDRAAQIGPALLVALLPFPIGLLLESVAWSRLFHRVSRRVSVLRLFRVRLATEALTLGLPSGGLFAEAASPVLLAGDSPVSSVLATATTKRLLVVRMHGMFVLAGVVLALPGLWAASPAFLSVVAAGGAALVVVSAVLTRTFARSGIAVRFRRVLDLVSRSRLVPAAMHRRISSLRAAPFETVDDELARLGSQRHPSVAALLFAQWLLEAAGSFVLLRLLGASIGFSAVIAIEGASTLVRGLAPFAPAGVGVQDLGYLALFGLFGLPDVAVIAPAFLGLKRLRELAFVVLGVALLVSDRGRPEPVLEAG